MKIQIKLITILILLSISLLSFKHPLHVSVTNVEYKADLERFELSFKLYKDDFQAIVLQKYQINFDIDSVSKTNDYDEYITKYINEHFEISFNDKKKQKLIFDNYTLDHEAVWINFKFDFKDKPDFVKIKNTLMTDLFNDQTNLMIFNYKEIQKAEMMNNKTTIVSFALKQ